MSSLSPNMLRVPYLTRFNPLNLVRMYIITVRGITKRTIALNS